MARSKERSHSWPSAHAWKACKPQGFEGSNPSLSAIRLIRQHRIRSWSSTRGDTLKSNVLSEIEGHKKQTFVLNEAVRLSRISTVSVEKLKTESNGQNT